MPGSGVPAGKPAPPPRDLPFLDEVVRGIVDSWADGGFLDRASAERELSRIAEWIRDGAGDPVDQRLESDRLLARRLADVLLQGVLTHWHERGTPEQARDYLTCLSSLHQLPWASLPQEADAFAARLADPDGFELVVQLGHDLRSPLTSITFLAETLRSGHSGPVNDHQRSQLGLIYSAAVGLTSVVADVVDLARVGGDPLDAEFEAFSIGSILESVRSVVQPLADVKGVEFRTAVTAHDRVRGHPLAVSRILLNLVINGLKFTDEGWVEVTVAHAGPNRVEFSVRDTGRGIPEENQRNLYQPFRKASHRKGSFFSSSGLGLSIARRLLLALGSELEVESRPDWGTRFHFVLDLPAVTSL